MLTAKKERGEQQKPASITKSWSTKQESAAWCFMMEKKALMDWWEEIKALKHPIHCWNSTTTLCSSVKSPVTAHCRNVCLYLGLKECSNNVMYATTLKSVNSWYYDTLSTNEPFKRSLTNWFRQITLYAWWQTITCISDLYTFVPTCYFWLSSCVFLFCSGLFTHIQPWC